MGESQSGFQPWDCSDCDIDGCRSHLLAYRKRYEARSLRAYVAWILLFTGGLVFLFFDSEKLVATFWIIAAFAWIESRRQAQMVDLIGVLWGLALLANRPPARA